MSPPLPLKSFGYAAGVLLGAGVLAACGHSAPTRFFTLDPVRPAGATASYAGPPVKLTAVHIPPSLDRAELVSEGPGGEVRVHDFEHWEAPLGQTARQALAEDLLARLPSGAVVGPDAPAGAGLALLSADILSFQVSGGLATLQAGWTLTLPASASLPTPASYRAPIETLQTAAPDGPGGEGSAVAMSALLGQLADRIAVTLPQATLALQRQQAAAAAAARPPVTTTHSSTTTTIRQARGGPAS